MLSIDLGVTRHGSPRVCIFYHHLKWLKIYLSVCDQDGSSDASRIVGLPQSPFRDGLIDRKSSRILLIC